MRFLEKVLLEAGLKPECPSKAIKRIIRHFSAISECFCKKMSVRRIRKNGKRVISMEMVECRRCFVLRTARGAAKRIEAAQK